MAVINGAHMNAGQVDDPDFVLNDCSRADVVCVLSCASVTGMIDEASSRDLRARAEECRVMAETLPDPEKRSKMMRVAAEYDQIALQVSVRELERDLVGLEELYAKLIRRK